MNQPSFQVLKRYIPGISVLIACVGAWSARSTPPLPDHVDLIPEYTRLGLLPRDQGRRDTCSLFAIAGVASYEWARRSPGQAEPLSEEFLIWASHDRSGRPGDQSMFYEAIEGLNAHGVCSVDQLPYRRTSSAVRITPAEDAIQSAAARRDRWRAHWIRRWNVAGPMTADELTTLQQALAAGHPVACGLRWPKGFSGAEIRETPPPYGVFDGHSIVLVGYTRDADWNGGGYFLFRNSNGPRWGQDGYGKMSFDYVTTYANDAVYLDCGAPDSEKPIARFEAETLPVATAQGASVNPQQMSQWGAHLWSNSRQLYCRASEGGSITLALPVAQSGRYRVRVLTTSAPDFGIVRAALDDHTLSAPIDLYSGRVAPGGALDLGTIDLFTGPHRLRFTVTGKNPASAGTAFGIDAVDLLKAK